MVGDHALCRCDRLPGNWYLPSVEQARGLAERSHQAFTSFTDLPAVDALADAIEFALGRRDCLPARMNAPTAVIAALVVTARIMGRHGPRARGRVQEILADVIADD